MLEGNILTAGQNASSLHIHGPHRMTLKYVSDPLVHQHLVKTDTEHQYLVLFTTLSTFLKHKVMPLSNT